MGQKINPTGFRLTFNKDWSSKWYAKSSEFPGLLLQDIQVRAYLKKRLNGASIGRIVVERPAKSARITIHSARPGAVIGKKGEGIEVLKTDLQGKMGVPVHINIEEI
ncbi:MAG: 30S ribosomal protein S3, partial [Haemophilus parainfluenzae]